LAGSMTPALPEEKETMVSRFFYLYTYTLGSYLMPVLTSRLV